MTEEKRQAKERLHEALHRLIDAQREVDEAREAAGEPEWD